MYINDKVCVTINYKYVRWGKLKNFYKENMPVITLFIVAMIWGSGFVASSMALDYFTTSQILAMRFSISFLTLLLIFNVRIKEISRSTWIKGFILGGFLFLAFLFQTLGLMFTTASKNAFLTATNLIMLPLLSFFILGRKVSKKMLLAVIFTFIGIGFLSFDKQLGGLNKGDLLTLICAVFFALQIFYTEVFVKDVEAWHILFVQMASASIFSIILNFIYKSPQINITLKALSPVLYLGLASTLLAFFLQTRAQKYTTSSQTGIILSTEAVFAMFFSVLILKDKITLMMFFGSLLIIVGILLSQTDKP